MRKHLDIIALAALLFAAISGTYGALNVFATKSEMDEICKESRCNEAGYQIDKVLRSMWEIEDRYRMSDGSTQPMGPVDSKRYRELLQQLQKWEQWRNSLGCKPPPGA